MHTQSVFINSTKPSLRKAERARIVIRRVAPVGGFFADFLLLCDWLVALMGEILHDAVIHRHVVLGLLVSPVALAELFESNTELLRHEVINDGVDGTVNVDAHPTEKQEPVVVVGRFDEGVHHHQRSVRHPQQGEKDDHHNEHLRYLLRQRRKHGRLPHDSVV